MDGIELLEQDHREVEKLFSEFEDAGDQAFKTKRQLVEKIAQELRVHSQVEEEIFYPALRSDEEEGVREAIEEHHLVDRLLEELEDMDPQDGQYDAKVTVLMENVRHHVEEEEGELFPAARSALGRERLQELGEDMEGLKERLSS